MSYKKRKVTDKVTIIDKELIDHMQDGIVANDRALRNIQNEIRDNGGTSSSNYTDEEKTKLASIESGAQVNIIEKISINGTELDVSEKGVDILLSTPELFGAKGDGITDDTEPILNALARNKNVVFDGTKTYAISSTIIIPADSYVDFNGATIIPMSNFDLIQAKPGCVIKNLIVKCTDVSDWDSSVIVFYGRDMFRASNLTRISNVKMFNDITMNDGVVNKGNGLYLYADDFGQFIEGLSVVDVSTCGFGKGIYIKGIDDSLEPQTNAVFIGGNNFTRYWSFKDTYGIYIDGRLENNKVTNNFFTELNVQSDYYGGSKYAIYCNGFSNYFSGCLYDYSILSYHPVTAVYFDLGGNNNVVEVTDGRVLNPNYCINLTGSNRIIKRVYENNILVPYSYYEKSGMMGHQDNALAFIDKRANCTLESLDGEPYIGSLSDVFKPVSGSILTYRATEPDVNNRRAIITINCKKVFGKLTHFIIQFGPQPPKSVKVIFYNATNAITLVSTNTNQNQIINISPGLDNAYSDFVYNIAKIVIELGGFNYTREMSDGSIIGEWTLRRIIATDSQNLGNTWLCRNGGEMYGDIEFGQDYAPILTDTNGKRYRLTVSTDGTLGTIELPEEVEEELPVASMVPTMAAGASWYNTELAGAEQNTITSVVFDNTYEPTETEDASWACDEDGYGNIMAYRIGTEVIIKSTTGSDTIKLNKDSSYMFANYSTNANFAALASITGTEIFEANKDTVCNGICRGNTVIKNPIYIPKGVTYLNYAFSGCSSLLSPPELPDGLLSLLSAFASCSSIQYLPEIPSTVTTINYAFQSCRSATKAPSVIPAKVSKMEYAFRLCSNISGTIEVNCENITNYSKAFENAATGSGCQIILTGTCSLLNELASTKGNGNVVVSTE